MGKIKAVALSDLHLGDTESLLFHGDQFNYTFAENENRKDAKDTKISQKKENQEI